jgi:broad specificity phosphatase PhoE
MKKLFLSFAFLLCAAFVGAQSIPSVIFIVRHCEKAMESTDNPNLSDAGSNRAMHLAEILNTTGLEAIYSTDTKRTLQTAEPLAKAAGLSPLIYEPRDANFANLLRKSGKKTLVVGHSNTVPELLNQLTGTKNYQPSDVYGDLWVLTVQGEQVSVLRLSF